MTPGALEDGLDIAPATLRDIDVLRSWFADADATYLWGGPHFRFPFDRATFLEDIFWGKMAAYSGFDETGRLIAFGQYYPKAERCHLARLVVHPHRRSDGIGSRFIAALIEVGQAQLGFEASSLFVVKDNPTALACYRKFGFEERAWPAEDARLPGIIFMVRG